MFLHRMKAYIDKFQPNASQANCFEGFWRITSKTNAKIEVRIFAFNSPSLQCLAQILFKRSEFRPAELLALKALLILIAYISEFMFACF